MQYQEIRGKAFEKIATIASALGSPARLKIIQILAQSPRSVEDLSNLAQESLANTSQHLQRLLRENLVVCEKKKTVRVYRISNPIVLKIWDDLQDLSQEIEPLLQIAEEKITNVDLTNSHNLESIFYSVNQNESVLLDIREPLEALATPITSALKIPLAELSNRLQELPKNKTIYIICRGRFCHFAGEAAKLLRDNGFTSYRLRESPFRIQQFSKIAVETHQ